MHHHHLPELRAMRLSGAAALLTDLTPAGLLALPDAARAGGRRDERIRADTEAG